MSTYKPKIIEGKIKNTGYPIDGHILTLSIWEYDNYDSWHLFGWPDGSDRAVMETMFLAETEAGMCAEDTLEEFAEHWSEWEAQGTFCLPLENVEVLRTVQEEINENPVIKIGPRKNTDRGGYICMPLAENVPEGRPDWRLTTCPECGRECWYRPAAEIAKAQGAAALCTMCALQK